MQPFGNKYLVIRYMYIGDLHVPIIRCRVVEIGSRINTYVLFIKIGKWSETELLNLQVGSAGTENKIFLK